MRRSLVCPSLRYDDEERASFCALPPSLPPSLAGSVEKVEVLLQNGRSGGGSACGEREREREKEKERERVYPSPSDPGEGERQSGANVIAEDKKVRGEMYSYVTCR